MRRIPATLALLAILLAGCGAGGSDAPGSPAASVVPGEPSTTLQVAAVPGECSPARVTVPTLPEQIPGYTEVDPATGLHMTGTPIEVDVGTYRLEISGLVDRPLSLTYDDLRCLPKVEATPELVCPGYFVDVATWAGVPLRDVLDRAGVSDGATSLRLMAADGYSLRIDLSEDALASAFLAYELEGETLPVLHGFPVRFVWPGHSGNDWVKWLVGIEVG
jgi:DMSO/TMAO reductase YedYZ molybdopterin-dependent catalytic subunit